MITHQTPLPVRLLAYTKERFPILPVFILVTLMTGASSHLLARWYGLAFSFQNTKLWMTIVTVFLFMLQLRMSDEIKDYAKDVVAYPERLLSKGLVNLDHIRYVLYSVVFIQIVINIFLGSSHLILLLILEVYAFLMAKEFFAKAFLEEQIGLYLILHQIILLPLMLYCALPFVPVEFFFLDLSLLYPLFYLSLAYTIYELSRKTWSSDRESNHADSYTRFWGINKTLVIEMIIIVVMAFLMNKMAVILPFAHKAIAGVLFIFYFGILMNFKKKPVRKNSKLVEHGGSLVLLGLYALAAFYI